VRALKFPLHHCLTMVHYNRFVFTLNNYTTDEHAFLLEFKDCRYITFGREVGESGTPHLQGFVVFHDRVSLSTAKRRLGSTRSHLEGARGSSLQATTYCHKDGDFHEYGSYATSQGRRTDIETYVGWLEGLDVVPTPDEICGAFPVLWVRYSRGMLDVANRLCPLPTVRVGEYRDWQVPLAEQLAQPCDNDRSIRFFVDPAGESGKSWFTQKFMSSNRDCQVLGVGSGNDLAHAIIETTRVFLFNVPRGGIQYLQYRVLESLKDRIVFSPKFQSCTKILRTLPHVVVFSNEEPNMTALTADRYDVVRLSECNEGALVIGFNP
jgi:hypothetical protein